MNKYKNKSQLQIIYEMLLDVEVSCGFPLGTPVSSHSPKIRSCDYSNLFIGVNKWVVARLRFSPIIVCWPLQHVPHLLPEVSSSFFKALTDMNGWTDKNFYFYFSVK